MKTMKNMIRAILLMTPAIIFGCLFLPIGTMTYTGAITIAILVAMWSDIMDIRDKLGIK